MTRRGETLLVVLALSIAGCAGWQRPKGTGWSCYTSSNPDNYMGARGSGCYREAAQCSREQAKSSSPGATACTPLAQATCFDWVNGDGSHSWACYPDASACSAYREFVLRLFKGQIAINGGPSGDRWTASACEPWN